MGAEQFGTYATGRDGKDAFRAAREQAEYESGHGGYSGTIAEKRSFELVDPGRLSYGQLKKAIELSEEIITGPGDGWDPPTERLFQKERQGPSTPSYNFARYVSEKPVKLERGVLYTRVERKRKPQTIDGIVYDQHVVTYRKLTKTELALAPLARRIRRLADDKWGPAVAVQITGKDAKAVRERMGWSPRAKVFHFFGSASS